MKYFAEPGLSIIDYGNLKTMFKFDENGEFDTYDPKLIEWIRRNKNFLKPVEVAAGNPGEKPSHGLYNCKKCSYSTANKGELMRHYRHDHPKNKEE